MRVLVIIELIILQLKAFFLCGASCIFASVVFTNIKVPLRSKAAFLFLFASRNVDAFKTKTKCEGSISFFF